MTDLIIVCLPAELSQAANRLGGERFLVWYPSESHDKLLETRFFPTLVGRTQPFQMHDSSYHLPVLNGRRVFGAP